MISHAMHGIVLCAGLGTRLRPLTNVLPKPAVPVGPLPAALRNVEQLLDAGFSSVHCNTHYLAEELCRQMQAAARSRAWPADKIRFWHENELLETGGGIAQIVHSLSSERGHTRPLDTMVVSGDIVADIPVGKMLERWSLRNSNETTLMASIPLDKPRKDVTWVSNTQESVVGFGADVASEDATARGLLPRVFSNHQIISGEVIGRSTPEKRSSIDLFYRASLKRGERILHLPFGEDSCWFDIGTPESYVRCARMLSLKSDHLSDWSSSIIQVVIRHMPMHVASDQTGVPLPSHDQTSPAPTPFDQANVIKRSHWQWLGHLHMLPNDLIAAIDSLCRGLNKNKEDVPLLANILRQNLFGHFLLEHSEASSTPSPALSSPEHVQGYLDVAFPHTLLDPSLAPPTPLLVPLDLLMPDSGDSRIAQGPSPFWLLITPPKL